MVFWSGISSDSRKEDSRLPKFFLGLTVPPPQWVPEGDTWTGIKESEGNILLLIGNLLPDLEFEL